MCARACVCVCVRACVRACVFPSLTRRISYDVHVRENVYFVSSSDPAL